MLLGKRPRPPMKRTTSMKNVVVDLSAAPAAAAPADLEIPAIGDGSQFPWCHADWSGDRRPYVSPELSRLSRRSSADYAAGSDAAPFLRACALCKGFLRSGRDIYMYRGEIAFCSLECREQQIKLDERKEKEKAKCSVSLKKDPTPVKANSATSESSSNNEMSERINLDQVIGLIL